MQSSGKILLLRDAALRNTIGNLQASLALAQDVQQNTQRIVAEMFPLYYSIAALGPPADPPVHRTVVYDFESMDKKAAMAVFNGIFPVLPSKEDDARKFAEEAVGSHGDHYNALMKASTTSRVTWTIQETPAGTFLSVWFEADETEAIFGHLATGTGEDVDWMRGRIKEVTGLDMTEPADGPPPEVILEWSA